MRNNPHQEQLEFCLTKKAEAMKIADASNPEIAYNAAQAVNAWDEIAGQLNKPTPVTQKRFEKAKETALRITNMMTKGGLHSETYHEILNLELPNN